MLSLLTDNHLLSALLVTLQLQGLTRLCLPDCGCSHFAGLLSHLPSLVVLALPFNKITSLEGLAVAAPTHKLAELDVSHNRISSWSSAWLSGCVALTTLDASFNATTQPTELLGLTRCAHGSVVCAAQAAVLVCVLSA